MRRGGIANGWLLAVFLCCIGQAGALSAQVDAEGDFDDYLSSIESDFYQYEDSINRDFADYLEQAWEEFAVCEGTEPPVYAGTMAASAISGGQQSEKPSPSASFFGRPLPFSSLPDRNFSLSGLAEKEIAEGWRQLAANDFSAFLKNYAACSEEMGLNDWGNYLLLKQVCQWRYASRSSSEQTLLLFYTLCNAGYKAKIGRAEGQSLVLLLPFAQEVYKCPFIRVGDEKYYLPDHPVGGLKKMYSFAAGYPRAKQSVSLEIRRPLSFPVKKKTRTLSDKHLLSYNQHLLDFYATVPLCDLSVYFRMEPSMTFAESMDRCVKPELADKSDLLKVRWLLRFVQQAFVHRPDVEVHGKEMYYFPEETAVYPYADCEDLSVFLSWLVRRYVTEEVLVLYYPLHVAIAVRKSEGYKGTVFKHQDKEYLICDPSYKGADPGKVIPACAALNPKVVSYFKQKRKE